MTKFFIQGSHQKTQQKHNKVKDYRLIIFENLFKCIKAFHLHQINRIVRKIKAQKENQQSEHNDSKLKQLQERLNDMKAIKKPSMKIIALYVMKSVLNIGNFEIFDQKFTKKHGLSIKAINFQRDVDNNTPVIHMLHCMQASEMYKKEIEKSGLLCEIVSRKKSQRKQKSKQRKTRKLVQKKAKGPVQQTNQNGEGNQDESEQSKQVEINLNKQSSLAQNKKQDKNSLLPKTNAKNQQTRKFLQDIEAIKPRTEFKKVGRNRALQKREQKKHKFIRKDKHSVQGKPIQKPKSKQRGSLHPSWQAKRQAKNQMFIQGFQGKRILL